MKHQALRIRERDAVRALLDNDAGAERLVLGVLAAAIASGLTVSPSFQELTNIVVAKAVLNEKLPPRPRGRAPDSRIDPIQVAYRYLELVDQGVKSEEAAEAVGKQFHISPRYVFNQLSDGSALSELSPEMREELRRLIKETDASVKPKPFGEAGRPSPFLVEPTATAIDVLLAAALDQASKALLNSGNSVQ